MSRWECIAGNVMLLSGTVLSPIQLLHSVLSRWAVPFLGRCTSGYGVGGRVHGAVARCSFSAMGAARAGRRSSQFTSQFTVTSSPIITSSSSWWTQWDYRWKQPKWISSVVWLGRGAESRATASSHFSDSLSPLEVHNCIMRRALAG